MNQTWLYQYLAARNKSELKRSIGIHVSRWKNMGCKLAGNARRVASAFYASPCTLSIPAHCSTARLGDRLVLRFPQETPSLQTIVLV
jgi:hypothetical protein